MGREEREGDKLHDARKWVNYFGFALVFVVGHICFIEGLRIEGVYACLVAEGSRFRYSGRQCVEK